MGVSPDIQRAWSTLEIKSVDTELRIIEGIASTPHTDRQGDLMDSTGAEFVLPHPLLWQHKHDKPIGNVIEARITSLGILIKAQIAAAGILPWIDEAWALINAKLVRGLSVGWGPKELVPLKGGRFHVKKWLWTETSAVTVPANERATIHLVKTLDLAALGTRSRVFGIPPGVSGSRKDSVMENIQERIETARQELQTKSARLNELVDAEAEGLSTDDQQEMDALTDAVPALTKSVKRLEAIEAAQASQAKPIGATPSNVMPMHSRIEVKDHAKELPKGTLFTRYAMAVAAGKGSLSDTLAYAKRWDAQTPEVSRYIKAVEGTSVVASPGWGGELVYPTNLAGEFVELVRPQTIIGRIEGFRTVPPNVRIPVQSGGSTVNWVGEAAPKPVTELDFTTMIVPYHKMAGIVVLTDELIRLSSPSAEAVVRRDLTEQIAQFRDQQFIRVAVSAGANNPASITNGVTSPAATGTTLAALYADLKIALATFDTAEISTDGLVIVTTPAVARTLSMMVTTLGTAPSGFNMSATGGTLLGYPVIVSASVDAGTLVIFKPSEIFLVDDGRVNLDASNQATLDMAGGASPDFNLWQRNCTAIRAEQGITWVKRRVGVVAVIDTIAYVPGT